MARDLDRVLAGRFRIDSLLGEGGMGSVYAATDLSIGRQVAIKLLRRELAEDATSLHRMREEAVALASLHHPNVVQLYDFQAGSPETTFLLMELVHGESLATRLMRTGAVPVATAVDYGCQLLSALSAAHGAGIIHRDIKPANVLVTPLPGNRELVKVLDFGIAKLTEETIRRRPTTAGILLGTPSAMSPEQASGRPVDARSDIYAAGLLLYTLVTGQNPFKGVDLVDTLRRVNDTIATPIVELRGDVPRELSDIVARAMAKDPGHRFQSALEFERALQSYASRAALAAGAIATMAPDPPANVGARASTSGPPNNGTWNTSSAPQATSATRTGASGASLPWLAIVGGLGVALAIGFGLVVLLMWQREGGPTAAAASASSAIAAPSATAPAISSAAAAASASAAATNTTTGSRVATRGSSNKPAASAAPASSLAPSAPPEATTANCHCFPTMGTVSETGHGGNQPLGARVVPLECRCNARGSERLCPSEVGTCARGSPGCRSNGFAECKKETFLGPKNGTTCSGWNSNGEHKTGEMDCNFPSTVTGYAGPTGNVCTGFTHGLQQVKGLIRCD